MKTLIISRTYVVSILGKERYRQDVPAYENTGERKQRKRRAIPKSKKKFRRGLNKLHS